jgi:hypothetical protein
MKTTPRQSFLKQVKVQRQYFDELYNKTLSTDLEYTPNDILKLMEISRNKKHDPMK